MYQHQTAFSHSVTFVILSHIFLPPFSSVKQEGRMLPLSRQFAKAKSFTLCLGKDPIFEVDADQVPYDGSNDIITASKVEAAGELYDCNDKNFATSLGEIQWVCNFHLSLLMTNAPPYSGSLSGPTLAACNAVVSIYQMNPHAKNDYLSTFVFSSSFYLDDYINLRPRSIDYEGLLASTLPITSLNVVGTNGYFPAPNKFNTVEITDLVYVRIQACTCVV